ncbi:MAG: DUF4071 domain-containing protein [Magnetococcales bacterium]|nr:DUF4071 domain-containing protein [Magnetococcales bacterium]
MEISTPAPSASELLAKVKKANNSAEYLLAYDQAMSGLEIYPLDVNLKFQAVLALARSGATGRAREAFNELGLAGSSDEDTASLAARILKDRFFSSTTLRDLGAATESANGYEKVYLRTGGYYPAINAASMWLFAGDRDRSAQLAAETLEIISQKGSVDVGEQYWLEATKLEAMLLLEDMHGTEEQIKKISILAKHNISDLASTRTQLKRICKFLNLDCGFLKLLKLPKVLHYTGHMIAPPGGRGRFSSESEQRVAEEIAAKLEELNVGFAYGSLACGGDILIAEALLQRGAELHIVFPFDIDEFKQISVLGGGDGWLTRFNQIKDRASSITFASEGRYLGDNTIFAYTSMIAMGLAKIRAQNLHSKPHQLAVWDGKKADGVAGTAADIDYWQKHGLESHVIDSGPPAMGVAAKATPAKERKAVKRALVPVLFTDMKSFSRFGEEEVMIFIDEVMGKLAKIINRHKDGILYRNTWGDAIFLVFADVTTAIDCVLELQASLWKMPLGEMGLPHDTGMRMAMHAGPVFESYDPILDKKAYFGTTLTRAARMEPITPVGEIYVSDAFAALATFEGPKDVSCEYVGHMPTAKKFGRMRMFHLKKTAEHV